MISKNESHFGICPILGVLISIFFICLPSTGRSQQIETIPVTIQWFESYCDADFDSVGEALACATQYLQRTNDIRLDGSMYQQDPGTWCFGGAWYEYGLNTPPTESSDCWDAAGAVPSCPPGYQMNNWQDPYYVHTTCSINVVKRDQTQKPCPFCVSDPIFPGTGDNQQVETDYVGPGPAPLKFQRIYDSNPQVATHWRTNLDRNLTFTSTYSQGTLTRPEGSFVFTYNGSTWLPDADVNYQLGGSSSTTWVSLPDTPDLEIYPFGRVRPISAVASASGTIKQTFTYSTDSTPISVAPAAGLLITAQDAFGHALQLTYDAQSRLATMTDPAGGLYQYAYDANGNMSSVTFPDGTSRQYLYNESAYTAGTNQPYALTGILDENGARFATFGYNASGQAILATRAEGAESTSVSYGAPPILQCLYTIDVPNHIKYVTCNYTPPTGTTVTDALGTARNYGFTSVVGTIHATGVDVPCNAYCSPVGSADTFDANGNLSSRTDFNGNRTTYTYDLTRNLETSRTEAVGTPQARTITTSWNANFRQPALVTEPNRTTGYTYDADGNMLTKTVTDTTVTPNVSRTWTYTYNTMGQVLTVKLPRTDVNSTRTYAYYSCSTGSQCGLLHTVTDALGHVTTYNTYNAHGQPLTITDPNGTVTTLTYDSRQRLKTRQVGTETTTFAYWPTGSLKQVTLPDASYVLYSYDDAHRLTQVSDGLGNSIDFVLDGMGNRTAENTYDPSNTLHRTHTRVINALNQLYQDVNAAGTAAVTTTFGYDNNGNQTSIAAPLARNTANGYDELNRLKQITDPANRITQFGYDANDNLTSVTDPRSLVTAYTYNGFGDLYNQTSPDTGATTNTYDSAGNLATSTDARGALSTYGYDALNRVTSVAYSLGGTTDQTLTFTYDTGTNGKGHLTGASDASHSLTWGYDPLGRVTSKSQTIGSVTQSVGYGYTNADFTSLTTPSGQNVAYGYNGNHQVTSVTVNGTTVLNSVTYEPLGPVNGWTWGNGTTTTRTYDTDGTISQIVSAGTKTYGYDNAFRITGITDTSPGAANWTYGYDLLDRITSGTSPSTTRGWTYDANGNRQTETGTAASTYSIDPASNRITGITGALARTYGYDAAGNTTGYSTVTATYNSAGRLKTLTNGSVTETSLYNALGQRIQINGGAAGTVFYSYDEAGHLLGEYGATGTLIQETVWLGDIPVATLRPSGSTVAIYYVHSDQLNTPRQVTRPSDNTPVWTWNSDPFGTDAANANPSGAGTFAYNLRFPGQIFDGQAGLHQNWMRDFDPAVGRYGESDPIGLLGGLNTYGYARGNPNSRSDRFGLIDGWTDPSGPPDMSFDPPVQIVRGTPANACTCHTSSGDPFFAPPGANFNTVHSAGRSTGLNRFNPFVVNDAVGHFGTFDFQRDGANNSFTGAYTDASNYAVGVYMQGAGYSLSQTVAIAGMFGHSMSSNAGSIRQQKFWESGWRDANAGRAQGSCP